MLKIIMNAKNVLLETALEMIRQGSQQAADDIICQRMFRLVGQTLFAIGRRVEPDIFESAEQRKNWLRISGDLFRDNLSQIMLREKILELSHTEPKVFNTVFTGNSSLSLYRQARNFSGKIRKSKNLKESERIVLSSLALAFMILAEDRYEHCEEKNHSMQEQIERKSAYSEILRNPDDRHYFGNLKENFSRFRRETLATATEENLSANFSKLENSENTLRIFK